MSTPQTEMAACTATTSNLSTQADSTTNAIENIATPSWLNDRSKVQQHSSSAEVYIRQGWSLVPVPFGTKGPRSIGWNRRESALKSQADLPEGFGIGLAHAYSKTMSLDIDNWDMTVTALAPHGIDLMALYNAPDAVIIDSGRAGHGKLLYAMPTPLPSKKINIAGITVYELRCGTVSGLTTQCVLPPSIHPDTKQPYRWAGNGDWQRLPQIPQALLDLWQGMVTADAARVLPNSTSVNASWNEIKAAVEAIPADCNRDEWVNVGMALQWAGVQTEQTDQALHIWNDWSKQSDAKYPGERDILTQWASFKATRSDGVRIGTLFKIANTHGWVRPSPDVNGMFPCVSIDGGNCHPLARVIPLDAKLKPVPYLITGLIQVGLVVIAGSAGVGKTTNLAPMLATVAHLCKDDHPMRPKERRKIVWVTEDPNQAQRIVNGMVHAGWFTLDQATGWFNIVDARRLPIKEVVSVEPDYRKFWVEVQGAHGPVILKPLVVFDTMNAVIDLEDENSNSQVGKAIAALKAEFSGYPLVVLAHLAKALKGRTAAHELAARGAGAIEADAHQTMYLVPEENGDRYLIFGKTRFERNPKIGEVKFTSHRSTILLDGDFGPEETVLRWSTALIVPMGDRSVAREDASRRAKEDATRQGQQNLMDEVLDVIRTHCADGMPVNRTEVRKAVSRKNEAVRDAVEKLISLKQVYEHTTGVKKRGLYALTDNERMNAIFNGCVISATAKSIDALDQIATGVSP